MKKKSKEKNNLIFVLVGVLVIVALLGGATYAYLSWQTATNQQTAINIQVKGGSLEIVGTVLNTGDTEINSTVLRPTNDCDGSAALVGEATVTANNETTTTMTATLKLDATLTRKYGSSYNVTIGGSTVDARSYLKWAIVDTTSSSAADNACNTPAYSGTFAGITSSTGISTGISFTVGANANVNKKYKIYIWLDETYQFTNTGNEITDPMEDLKLVVKWSTSSTLTNAQ